MITMENSQMNNRKTRTATRGRLTADGRTISEAKDTLETQIDWLCQTHFSVHMEKRFNLMLVITPIATGWVTGVFDPNVMTNGQVPRLTSYYGKAPFVDILESIRLHAAQQAWTPDSDDTQHVTKAGLEDSGLEELRKWIYFQRSYLDGIKNGKTQDEAWREALAH